MPSAKSVLFGYLSIFSKQPATTLIFSSVSYIPLLTKALIICIFLEGDLVVGVRPEKRKGFFLRLPLPKPKEWRLE
jgi:hypothetical protein